MARSRDWSRAQRRDAAQGALQRSTDRIRVGPVTEAGAQPPTGAQLRRITQLRAQLGRAPMATPPRTRRGATAAIDLLTRHAESAARAASQQHRSA